MIIDLSVEAHALSMRMWTSFSVDEILLPSSMNLSANFRDLPFSEEMTQGLWTGLLEVLFNAEMAPA